MNGSTTSPAEEVQRLLRRAEALILSELHHDDEARSNVIDLTNRLYDAATLADPQSQPTA